MQPASQTPPSKKFFFVSIVSVYVLLFSGCAVPQNSGRMIRDGEIDRLIESATVLPGHIYYYAGPEAQPDAIIAIKDGYTLTSKYWVRVDDVADRLKGWNTLIDNAYRFRYAYEGFYLMTPEGTRAGIWYSPYDYTVVRFPDPSTIIVYTPTARTDERKLPGGGLR